MTFSPVTSSPEISEAANADPDSQCVIGLTDRSDGVPQQTGRDLLAVRKWRTCMKPVAWPEAGDLCRGYLLLDTHYEALPPGIATHPCVPSGTPVSACVLHLVDLAACSQAQRQTLYERLDLQRYAVNHGDFCVIGAWLHSPEPAAAVAEHIASLLRVRNWSITERYARALWPIGDARYFARMSWLLRPEQMRALFDDIIESWQIVWQGQCYRCAMVDLPPPPHEVLAWLPDAQQWADLTLHDDARVLAATLPLPQDLQNSTDYPWLLAQMSLFAYCYARDSLNIGHIPYASDRYTRYVMLYGKAFSRHAKLAPHWQGIARGQTDPHEIFNTLNEDDEAAMQQQGPAFYLGLRDNPVFL